MNKNELMNLWQGMPHFKQDKVKEIKRTIIF